MNLTALLRGILRQLLEDGAITDEQYGSMIRRIGTEMKQSPVETDKS